MCSGASRALTGCVTQMFYPGMAALYMTVVKATIKLIRFFDLEKVKVVPFKSNSLCVSAQTVF